MQALDFFQEFLRAICPMIAEGTATEIWVNLHARTIHKAVRIILLFGCILAEPTIRLDIQAGIMLCHPLSFQSGHVFR